jgi:hypothetical protein
MTDLKMCKKGMMTVYSKAIDHDGWPVKSQEFDMDVWIPIEPQPSCSNCEKESWCGIASEIRHSDGELDKFFCASWKAKK